MAKKESLEIKNDKELACVDYLLKFNHGIKGFNLPTTEKQRKNCRKLLECGVMSVFANALESIDSSLKICLSDDFSQICLRKRDGESLETLMTAGIGNDETGAREIRVRVKDSILPPIPINQIGITVLRDVLQSVVISSRDQYKANNI